MENLDKTIERAKQQLEQMIDLNPQVMLLVTHEGEVTRVNRAFLDLLDCTEFEQVLNRKLGDLLKCDDASFFSDLMDSDGASKVVEHDFELPGKGKRRLELTALGTTKEMSFCVLAISDVTEDKQRARHIEKAHKKEAVQELAGALMHNLNQSLTVIMVRAQLLHMALDKGDGDKEEFKKGLRDIMKFTMGIADVLNKVEKPADYVTEEYSEQVDILDIERSKGSYGTVEVQSVMLALNSLILMTLDAHERGAAAHAERSARCAGIVAREMGYDEQDVLLAERCARFHDIGKLGILDAILQKPGELTAEETIEMKRHPEIGYNLLVNFPFLKDEAEVAYAHQEKFDGTGYPRGLKGEEIHRLARLISVVDAYDAMRFERVYRKPMPADEIISELESCVGTQFDPEVVEALKRCRAEIDKATGLE